MMSGPQAVPVTDDANPKRSTNGTNSCRSMLEDPSHQDVARWGKDGDSFVVVEVSIHDCCHCVIGALALTLNLQPGRKVYQVHPTKAFQAQ